MKKNHYIPHEWNVVCDICSKKIKASESRLRWDGFIVCSKDFETRHPQDFIQTRQDKMTVPFSRPRAQDVFVDVPYIVYYVVSDYMIDYSNYINDE